jgi:glucosamine--fructose-6-phosphate aminotransferase (isomerizing)
MALQWLADVIGNRDLRRTRKDLSGAPGAVEDYLRAWKKHVKEFAELLKNVRNLFFVGRGNSLAAVGTGALIAKESAHFATEGLSSAAFRHGPFEMLNDETLVLVFGGDPKAQKLNQYLLKDIRACGGKAELVGPHSKCLPCALPTSDAAVRPILEILPIEMVTLSLAALGGREAGRFTFATKVTTKE